MLSYLARPHVLWVTGLATLALTLAFGVWIAVHDLHIIDEIWRQDRIRDVVGAMSDAQRSAHIRMTVGLDVAYPLAYGTFLAGLAYRAWGKAWPAIPALATIPFDLVEGAAQLSLLNAWPDESWGYAAKAVATPLKLGGFVSAVLIGLAAVGVMVWRRLRGDQPPPTF